MTKKEVQAIFDEVLKMFQEGGIDGFKINRINPVLNFKKTTRVLGTCKYREWEEFDDPEFTCVPSYCDIYISEYAIQDKESVCNTLAHEIIHTFDGCQNHGKRFKEVASNVNDKLGLNVKTRGTAEECAVNGIDEARRNKAKYILKCKKCGHEYSYTRKTKTVKNYKYCYCPVCSSNVGDLELIEL